MRRQPEEAGQAGGAHPLHEDGARGGRQRAVGHGAGEVWCAAGSASPSSLRLGRQGYCAGRWDRLGVQRGSRALARALLGQLVPQEGLEAAATHLPLRLMCMQVVRRVPPARTYFVVLHPHTPRPGRPDFRDWLANPAWAARIQVGVCCFQFCTRSSCGAWRRQGVMGWYAPSQPRVGGQDPGKHRGFVRPWCEAKACCCLASTATWAAQRLMEPGGCMNSLCPSLACAAQEARASGSTVGRAGKVSTWG